MPPIKPETLAMIERLIGFDTTSRDSNLGKRFKKIACNLHRDNRACDHCHGLFRVKVRK